MYFQSEGAVDPEFLISRGEIGGEAVDMKQLRPAVLFARRALQARESKSYTY